VFKVCDQPHPELIRTVVKACLKGEFSKACAEVDKIYNEGYNLTDIVGTMTRVI
jgi:replication factor C subunit 2/4